MNIWQSLNSKPLFLVEGDSELKQVIIAEIYPMYLEATSMEHYPSYMTISCSGAL